MTKGKIHFLLLEFLPQQRSAPKPWTFKRVYINDFFESGNAGSWEDHDWLEWTSTVGTTQVTLAHFMLKHDTDPPSKNNQHLVLAQDEEEEENEEEEKDNGVISYWNEDDGDQFFEEEDKDFPNESEPLYDITDAIRVQGPLKYEDQSAKLSTLFEEEDETESNAL